MKNKKVNIEIHTLKQKLSGEEDQIIDLLVRITPPAINPDDVIRPKLNLGIVLDRSGSMGRRKIQEAKDAAKYCIDQMLSGDRLSMVIFNENIDVLIPSQKVENKDFLNRTIDSVRSGGSTALHEAWVRGGLQVSEHLDESAVNRVLLITDGEANVGETNVDRIVGQTRDLEVRGISTSTIGIGRDFNEELLLPMAEAGSGNAWHVAEPGDLQRIFEVELNGLIAQIGHSVTFGVKPRHGVRFIEILNDFDLDGSGRHKLPNLRAGSPLDIVVRLKVPATVSGTNLHLADFDLSYIGQDSKLPEKIKVKFEIEFAGSQIVAGLEENKDVVKAVRLLMNARARREVVERIDHHDLDGAKSSLAVAVQMSRVIHSRTPSPELQKEIEDLVGLESKIDEDDVMARKLGRYQSYSRRTGKDR